VVSNIFLEASRLSLKMVLLGLARWFGQEITVKSTQMNTGELMIIGCDRNGHECFNFMINKNTTPRNDSDSKSIAEIDLWDFQSESLT
jgi:hypothetical protein